MIAFTEVFFSAEMGVTDMSVEKGTRTIGLLADNLQKFQCHTVR